MSGAVVRVATPADRPRVVETVVAAFVADSAFRYFFPDATTYEHEAGVFAAYLFDLRVAHSTVWVAGDGAAVAMWEPPGVPGKQLRLDLPAGTLARLEAYEQTVHPALPDAPHWYLGVLATHPDHAGRRWGRAVMAAGLERARADGLPAYLETTTASNVALYERAGWHVDAAVPVDALTVRVMRQG